MCACGTDRRLLLGLRATASSALRQGQPRVPRRRGGGEGGKRGVGELLQGHASV
jgi:hypothetical protein